MRADSEEHVPLIACSRYLVEHEKGTGAVSEADDSDVSDVSCALDIEQPEWLRLSITHWPRSVGSCLDRVTVLGTVPMHAVAWFRSAVAVELSLGDRQSCSLPYRWAHSVLGGSGFFQYGDSSDDGRLVCRYDFNPAKADAEAVRRVLGLFEFGRFSRIDVAVDYPFDLSAHSFDRARVVRQTHHGADGRLETVYLGSPNSVLRFRCYDKGREREYSGQSAPPDASWWRVEAVYRPRPGEDALPLGLFDSLRVSRPTAFMTGAWKDHAAILYAAEHPEWLRRQHWRVRKLVGGALSDVALPLDEPPMWVYAKSRRFHEAELEALVHQCGAAMP